MALENSSEAFLRSYLDNARLPGYSAVYAIGTFDQKKTVATQQQRASVIALAAVKNHRKKRPSAAVIGGGFAGLSCAATLLKLGCSVSLFEQKDRLIPIQANCSDRFLHPTLYEWPNYSSDDEFSVSGIQWKPGYAYDVAAQVIDSFNSISDPLPPSRYSPHLGMRIEKVDQDANRKISLTSERAFMFDGFDIVFVAIGFGLEKRARFGQWIGSYWQNSAMSFLDGRKFKPERVLVSGAGDGGLISVLNCALKNYDHTTLHTDIDSLLNPSLLHDITEIEKEIESEVRNGARPNIIALYDKCLRAKIATLVKAFEPLLSEERQVTFNSTVDGVFTPVSSAINRFLVYILLRGDLISFKSERINPSMVSDVDLGEDNEVKHAVKWKSETLRYDHIVIRHGVPNDHFLRTFPDMDFGEDGAGVVTKLSLEDAIPGDVKRFLTVL